LIRAETCCEHERVHEIKNTRTILVGNEMSSDLMATVSCSLLVVRVLAADQDRGDLPDVFYRAAHLEYELITCTGV
jgi:hypothetical protein